MQLQTAPRTDVPNSLIEAIRSFPTQRQVEHCGTKFVVSPFDIYAVCPGCGNRIKLRSFSAIPEIEDVFEAVFEWMLQPGAERLVRQRQRQEQADQDD
jgi:hypothetical protein